MFGVLTAVCVLLFGVNALYAQSVTTVPIVAGDLPIGGLVMQTGFGGLAAFFGWCWGRDIKRYESEKQALIMRHEEERRTLLSDQLARRDEELERRIAETNALFTLHRDQATTMTKLTSSVDNLVGNLMKRGVRAMDAKGTD